MPIFEVTITVLSDATIFVEADNAQAASEYLDSTREWVNDAEITQFANPREITKKSLRLVTKKSDIDMDVLASYGCPYNGDCCFELNDILDDE